MNIQKEIEVIIGEGYIVERDSDGAAMGCTLTRGTWNVIGTGAFFAYEREVIVRGIADKCTNCDEWVLYLMRGKCPECLGPSYGMTEDEQEQMVRY